MAGAERKRQDWFLARELDFTQELARLPAKHRSQVTRKVSDLMDNPHPGGSKTVLVGYEGLYRLRAGDYRIIYTYDETAVRLLSLRPRDEQTYEHLDDIERKKFDALQLKKLPMGNTDQAIDWDVQAKKWAAPKPRIARKLPYPITKDILQELEIPPKYHPPLLALKDEDDLLECTELPSDIHYVLIERLFPMLPTPLVDGPVPVIVLQDLVDSTAAEICGPLDATAAQLAAPHVGGIESQSKVGEPAKTHLTVPIRTFSPLIIVTTRRVEPMQPYKGNSNKGTNKDAKYTVKLDGTIQLKFSVGPNERALLTTDAHPELVALVNEAKKAGGSGSDGGSFVINEYRHVLVPVHGMGTLFAGKYTRDLEFDFDGVLITPVAPSNIRLGEVWPGPHVGIKYTVAAGCSDIRYEKETMSGNACVQRDVLLSSFHGMDAITQLLTTIRKVKPDGGRMYINEARELFAPQDGVCTYIGHLGKQPWFPGPDPI